MDQALLWRYPKPKIITYDFSDELIGSAFKDYLIGKKYGIKAKFLITENPQPNYILEKIHQDTENLVHTFDLKNNYLDKEKPWSGILEVNSFMVLITYHTMLQLMPIQMVFVCDMILNNPLIYEWEDIRRPRK